MDIRVNSKNVYTDKNIKEKTIVNLSDVHFLNDVYINRLYQLIELLKEIKPDIICIAGDFLDTFDDSILPRQKILDILKQISTIAKTVMSFAAHDYSSIMTDDDRNQALQIYFNQLKAIGNNFVPFLPDEKTTVDLGDFTVSGYSLPLNVPYSSENTDELMLLISSYITSLGLSSIDYNSLVCHSPIPFFNKNGLKEKSEMNINEINLILSGHLHAGMMPKFLEFLNLGLVSPDKKPFSGTHHNTSGLFAASSEDLNIDISRGFIKVPGTLRTELGEMGRFLYQFNQVYKSDIDLVKVKKMH